MNFVWGLLLWLGGGVAVLSMIGIVGFWNLFAATASYNGVTWRGHLVIWLTAVLAFLLVSSLTPRKVTFPTDGDMQFSDERVIEEIIEWVR